MGLIQVGESYGYSDNDTSDNPVSEFFPCKSLQPTILANIPQTLKNDSIVPRRRMISIKITIDNYDLIIRQKWHLD